MMFAKIRGAIRMGKVVPVNCKIHKTVFVWGTVNFNCKTSLRVFNPYLAHTTPIPIKVPANKKNISNPIRIKNCNPGRMCLLSMGLDWTSGIIWRKIRNFGAVKDKACLYK